MHRALSRSPLACFDSEVLLNVQDLGMFFFVLFFCSVLGGFFEM